MPTRFWQHTCCGPSTSWAASRNPCPACGALPTLAHWMLGTQTAMLRYQMHYGLKPIGPHRGLADRLLNGFHRLCEYCAGDGLLDSDDFGTAWVLCPGCQGWGSHPFPNDPAIKAMRREVARRFPDAVASEADSVGADDWQRILLPDGSQR